MSRIPSLDLHAPDTSHKAAGAPRGSEIELSMIRRSHPNVLLIGPNDSNERALRELLPSCRPPIDERNPEFEMPIGRGGTFVLRCVESLSLDKQLILHEWFTREGGRIQVVSLATPRLFQLVTTGAFHEGLFYRLNVIMLMTAGT